MNQAVITIQNVSKIYKLYDSPVQRLKESIMPFAGKRHQDFYALDDVSFIVNKGETVSIVGKNGSGKSTLLKIITGVLTPSVGLVEVRGKIAALLELGAGFNPELTGIENIYLSGMIMGYNRDQMDAKLDTIVAFTDIGEYIRQPVKTYSSGMFARLAFAVNTNVDPDIFIVDEALSVGDIFFQAKSMRQIKKMVDNGTTLLFVSHDLNAVRSLCQSALWLKEGRVYFFGDAPTVTAEYGKALVEDINSYHIADSSCDCPTQFTNSDRSESWTVVEDEFGDDPKYFRTGTGAARFRKVEILDAIGKPMKHSVEFNQEITIKCFIEIMQECKNLSVDYHIRNKHGQEVLGNDTHTAGTNLHARSWKKGECLIATFKARLPIIHGIYSVSVLISSFPEPVSLAEVIFCDWIENAFIFEMRTRKPSQIFDFVYLPGEVNYQVF
ncbi:MAG: ABC transporter ATP-binding protein [Negativicutes bacterium]|nr:ABC transporter ATP-binding protein [Negativicutes bacterium]